MFMVFCAATDAIILLPLSGSTPSRLLILNLWSLIAGDETMGPHHEAYTSDLSRAD
jgi:hypothetical protein